MFIRYFIEVPKPAGEVEGRLLRAPRSWADGAAREAEAHGERLLVDVGFGSSAHRVSKTVEVEFGEPIRFPSRTILPMSWTATGLERLFPQLDADIEVASLGPLRSQLSISARYSPPLGAVGQALDRALLHRVAEATIKNFLDRAAETLSAPVPSKEA